MAPGFKFAEGAEVVHDRLDRQAMQPLGFELLPLLVDDANADSLLVEVDADILHGASPFVETGNRKPNILFTTSQRIAPGRLDLLHSFTLIGFVASAHYPYIQMGMARGAFRRSWRLI